MLTRADFLSLNFVAKEDFTGSCKGMRFMLHKEIVEEEKKLKAYVWSEPFGFDSTPDDQKLSGLFSFDEEGLQQAIDWMNERYELVRSKEESM
jgi:hypothetical protein